MLWLCRRPQSYHWLWHVASVTCHHIHTVNDLSACVTGVCACSVCTSVAQVLVMHMHTQVSCVIGAFASTGCFCLNGGSCNNDNVCECPEQFTGTHCEQTLCKTHNYYLPVMLQPVVQWYSCRQPHIGDPPCHNGACHRHMCLCTYPWTGDACDQCKSSCTHSE